MHAYARLAFLVRPGILGWPQLRKTSETSIKIISWNEGDRDGKSAKRSATRNYTSSAVVVNVMYPRPYIIFDPKGVIEHEKII